MILRSTLVRNVVSVVVAAMVLAGCGSSAPVQRLQAHPKAAVLTTFRVEGHPAKLTIQTLRAGPMVLCMNMDVSGDFQHTPASTGGCGFGANAQQYTVDTDNSFKTEYAAGPAPPGTRRVGIENFCSPTNHKVVAHVSTHALPSWVPRAGRWFLYIGPTSKIGGNCVDQPVYFSATGKQLKLGEF